VSQDSQLSPQVIDSLIRREQLSLAGRLLRGVVHNLSGALQTVRLPLDLLEMQSMRGESQNVEPKLGGLQQGVARLSEELNLLAGLSQQMYRLEPETFDLSLLAQEQLALWRADMYFKHEIQLTAELSQPGPLVRAAYADIALTLDLLIANAVESLQETGRHSLRLASFSAGETAVLSVIDDGPGPAPEIAPDMFKPFVGSKKPGNDGLGLFLARAAAQRWGGELRWLESPPGGFELRLPQATG
jgi:signal transduction histidine kinase